LSVKCGIILDASFKTREEKYNILPRITFSDCKHVIVMLETLFNTTTLSIFLIFTGLQYVIKFAVGKNREKPLKNLVILANTGNFLIFSYVVYYSSQTSWWALIGIANLTIVFFILFDHFVLNFITKQIKVNKLNFIAALKGQIAKINL
jgi:hypothetical protein